MGGGKRFTRETFFVPFITIYVEQENALVVRIQAGPKK